MQDAKELSDRRRSARPALGVHGRGIYARSLATAGLCLALTGCGLPLYLHKDAYEKETAEIKESVDKLDVEAAYAALRTDMIDLAKAEDGATLVSLVAARNHILARLIDPGPQSMTGVPDIEKPKGTPGNDPDNKDPMTRYDARERLRLLISADLCALHGLPGKTDCAEPAGFDAEKLRTELDLAFRQRDEATQAVRAFSRQLSIAYRGLATDKAGKAYLDPNSALLAVRACGIDIKEGWLPPKEEPDPQPPEPELATPKNSGDWEKIIRRNNKRLLNVCTKAATATEAPLNALIELIGTLGAEANQINIAAADLAASLQRAESSRKEAVDITNQINEELRGAQESATDPTKLSAVMKSILASIENMGALGQIAGYDILLELTQCGLLADLRTALPEEGADKAETEATAAQAAGTEQTTDKVIVETKSVAETSGGGVTCVQGSSGISFGDDGEGNALVVSLAKLLVGLEKDKEALGRLERVTATVLAGVQLRHKRDLANVRAEFETRNIQLLRGKLHALLTHAYESRIALLENAKIKQSARSFAELRKSAYKRHVGFALNAYAQSWDRGKLPVEILNFRLLQARRAYDTEVAGLKAKNYRDLIKPLTDALAAYGAGGITPELIGQIFGNAAIAVGIAKS